MTAFSETALAHHADDGLTSTARALTPVPDRVERELAAVELRQAFCAQLKAARERKGISLRTVSDTTKVSESLFADLERCDLSRWPTGIYRRAFFREYAAFIGMPGESTVSEFVRLFPEDLDRGSAPDTLVPGPLRLTFARRSWRQLSPLSARAAGLDAVAVLLASAAVAWLAGTGLWTTLGVVALCYHAAATAVIGCSPGTWLIRSRGYRRRSTGLRLAR